MSQARRQLKVDVPVTNTAGIPRGVDHYTACQIMVKGTFVATYHVETELIPGQWDQVGSDVTTAMTAPLDLPVGAVRVRLRRSAFSSGATVCMVSGPMD